MLSKVWVKITHACNIKYLHIFVYAASQIYEDASESKLEIGTQFDHQLTELHFQKTCWKVFVAKYFLFLYLAFGLNCGSEYLFVMHKCCDNTRQCRCPNGINLRLSCQYAYVCVCVLEVCVRVCKIVALRNWVSNDCYIGNRLAGFWHFMVRSLVLPSSCLENLRVYNESYMQGLHQNPPRAD